MRIPGRRRFLATARWLRSRGRERALILGYHRVTDLPRDPYGIAVHADQFAAQLGAIRRYARPVTLAELQTSIVEGRPFHGQVVVTFDDGYVDILHQAKPLLERVEVPATVFVVAGSVGQPFWWDVLDEMLRRASLPSRLHVPLGGGLSLEWQHPARTGAIADLRAALHEKLRALTTEERQRALEALGVALGVTPAADPRHRAMGPDELVQLTAGGLIDIGSHSMTHRVLTDVGPDTQRAEISGSRTELERLLGRPVTAFSYPHGGTSASVARCVRDAGFTSACASHNDVVTRHTDPFALPRFWVPSRSTTPFSRWLRRWLG